MSVHHLSAVADLSDLPPTCKLVLYGLAIDAATDARVDTTNAKLRQRTGLSERSVRSTLRTLENMGKLKFVRGGTAPNMQYPVIQLTL